MLQSPWEADRLSATKEIPRILWNLKVHYHVYNSPPPVPILGHINPAYAPISLFLKIHLNIILTTMFGSSKWSLSLRFPHQNPVYTFPLPHTCYVFCPSHFFDLITRTILGEVYRSWSSSLWRFLHSPVTSSLLGQNMLLSTLFSYTLSLRSSLDVSNPVSHPYKTTDKIIVLYILIFNFWIANWKTKDSAPNDSKRSLTSFCS